MKKCPDCEKEIDKYTFACEYCGRLVKPDTAAAPMDAKRRDREAQNRSPAGRREK